MADAILRWNGYRIGGGYWSVEQVNPALRDGTPLYACSAAAVRDIDAVLAALVDIKPMADYGEVGTYDTVQARRQRALAKAEKALLDLRRKLNDTAGVALDRGGEQQ